MSEKNNRRATWLQDVMTICAPAIFMLYAVSQFILVSTVLVGEQ